MTAAVTTARVRQFPESALIAKDNEKVIGFTVYGLSRDEALMDVKSNGIMAHWFQQSE